MFRMWGWFVGLTFLVTTEALASDLGLAGALSGAGQGLSNAMSQMMTIEGARQLQQQQYEQQKARDEAAYQRQQAAYDRTQTGQGSWNQTLAQQQQALQREWETLAEAKRQAINEFLLAEQRVLDEQKHWFDEQKRAFDLRQAALVNEPDSPERQASLAVLEQEVAHYTPRVADFNRRWANFIERAVANGWVRTVPAEQDKQAVKAALAEERLRKWRAGETIP